MASDQPLAAIRADFIEKIGLITQAEGFPRIAGRVFGLLIFDGNPVSFGDLATHLQVSRGSISSSIRLLEERGLVKRVTKPGDRRDYFQLAPNPYVNMLDGVQKRARATQADIAETIDALPDGADALGRLREYVDFHACTDTAIGIAIADLNAPKHTQ